MEDIDIHKVRQAHLRELRDSDFAGKLKAFADHVDLPADYLGRLVRGQQNCGEQVARKIEKACHRPPYWLDGHPIEAVDADMLWRCMQAAAAWVGARKDERLLDAEQQVHMASALYDRFHNRAVTDDDMLLFLEGWFAFWQRGKS